MKIEVRVKPGAKQDGVEKMPDGCYRVKVKSQPHEGKANAAVVELLAAYFKVPRSAVRIVRGQTGRSKLIDIV